MTAGLVRNVVAGDAPFSVMILSVELLPWFVAKTAFFVCHDALSFSCFNNQTFRANPLL